MAKARRWGYCSTDQWGYCNHVALLHAYYHKTDFYYISLDHYPMTEPRALHKMLVENLPTLPQCK